MDNETRISPQCCGEGASQKKMAEVGEMLAGGEGVHLKPQVGDQRDDLNDDRFKLVAFRGTIQTDYFKQGNHTRFCFQFCS